MTDEVRQSIQWITERLSEAIQLLQRQTLTPTEAVRVRDLLNGIHYRARSPMFSDPVLLRPLSQCLESAIAQLSEQRFLLSTEPALQQLQQAHKLGEQLLKENKR